MTDLAVTSITNFLLASLVFFLAGMIVQVPKERFSAAWFWGFTMTMLGLGALLGGIDHGFFEIPGLPRYAIQRADWVVLGLVTFGVLMTAATQFFSRQVFRGFLVFGVSQWVVYSIIALFVDSFLVVIINYAPVMIFLLVMSALGLKSGLGSRQMITGIVILFVASGIQAAGLDTFSPVDRNGVYHLLSMVGVYFLYLGGRKLKTAREIIG